MDFVRPVEVFHYVAQKLSTRTRVIIANHNLHSLALLKTIPQYREFFSMADLVEVDSTPVILWAKLLGHDVRGFHRCTYLDWRDEFWSAALENQWRVFYLGCRPGVIEPAVQAVLSRTPGLILEGRHGYFDATPGSADNAAVLSAIHAFQPDIVLVGMGMPRQELWVHNHIDLLPICATFTVGGAFDYEAGAQRPAPRWMARLSLEWLFRLVSDPRRLFHRYCIEPFVLISPALHDVARYLGRNRLD
jgi:N-acetylglucosaminyldiphosphoundecaprenol N-acetyl-beta-D-mannosaminyltransferase